MISIPYFILTSEWKDSGNQNIIKLCTTGPQGYAELYISNKPVFFAGRETDSGNISGLYKRKNVDLTSFSGEALDALYFNTQSDLQRAAGLFDQKKVRVYESDIDPVRRLLMEKSIYGSVSVTGDPEVKEWGMRFVNPVMQPSNYYPDLKIVSIDIETDGKGSQLFSIALHFTGRGNDSGKVFMVGSQADTAEVTFVKDEKILLESFFNYLQIEDPDVITGWHVIGFDLMFLEKKCRQYNYKFRIGRNNSQGFLRERRSGGYFASTSGRLIIDAPSVLRSVFYSFDDFKLETVSRELLGDGKIIPPGPDKVKQIEDYFHNDKPLLAEYNLKDAVLVNRIIQKTGLVDLLVKRSMLSGLVADQAGMMTAAFDHFYLPKLHKKNYAAPDVKDISGVEHAAGGYVMDPEPGIYENVIVLDFKSLYPSIIRTFKIDPLSRLKSGINTVLTPAGIPFSATENILPGFIKTLMEKREEAKKKKDKQLSIAIKLLMNSFYGVMGSYGCRFYHPDLPTAITGTGKWLLLGSRDFLQRNGYSVIYGDTDSLFIKLKENESTNPDNSGVELAFKLNRFWEIELKKKFNVISCLEIEYEKYYRKFIITPSRGAITGAKKRYAGLLKKGDEEIVEFTGMESIRSDWTKLAKDFQAELYKRIFSGGELDEWIRSFVTDVKAGKMNEKLVYKKRIRKNLDEYKNLPPQIRAAKMSGITGSSIKYVITLRGPVPVGLEHSDIDYQHYIEKQLKPIADSVLVLEGKSFDSIINPTQLSIFE